LTTPRATISTRVLETIDITAILSTPGFHDELGQARRLAHRRIAADLAVVGRLSAVGADGIEQGERAAAGADHEAQVAVEVGDVAGYAAVVHPVDLFVRQLELGGLVRLARLLVADAEVGEQRLLARSGLVLHVHVGVKGYERAVLELAQPIDPAARHVLQAGAWRAERGWV
jgi:hypothetical protein